MKGKKYFYIISCMITLGMFVSLNVNANSNAQIAENYYYLYLSQTALSGSNEYDSDCYDIVDINGDKIPELLLAKQSGTTYLYTFDFSTYRLRELKSRPLGKMKVDMYYSKKKHLVCFIQGDTGGKTYTVFKYKGKKVKKQYKLTWYNGRYTKEGYKYNGKRISQSKGERKEKNITKKFKELRYYY